MITILVNDGSVYRFPSQFVADLWVEKHPEEYEYDKENLSMFVSEPPEDSLVIQDILHIRTCKNCGRYLKFELPQGHGRGVVECPACNSRTRI